MQLVKSLAAVAAIGVAGSGIAGAAPLRTFHRADSSATTTWAATKTQAGRLANAIDLGEVSPVTKMAVSVALTSNVAGAQAYIKHEYTPGDAYFHQFLTPAQYTNAFGPTTAAATAVANYLASMGFTQIIVTPNRTLVTGIAAAPIVERAFNTDIHSFNLGGQLRYSNVLPAQVPAQLGSVVTSVLGLHNNPMSTFLQYPRGKRVTRTLTPRQDRAQRSLAVSRGQKPMSNSCIQPGATFCAVSEFYTDDLESYYDASSSKPASNTNIAIITDADTGQLISDLRLNEAVNGLRQVPVTVVNAEPGYPTSETPSANQTEFSMDTQTSTGIAGDAKGLYLYNVGGLTDQEIAMADNRWVTDDVAPVASQSLGECEYNAFTDGGMFAEDEIFIESMVQGQTMFASSGDGGASCAFTFATNGLVNVGLEMAVYPASSAWVMGAGGTSALANGDGSYNGEVSWAWGGGGVSVLENPGWWTYGVQPGWLPEWDGLAGGGVPIPGVGGGNGRTVPDVAMDADANVSAGIFFEYGAKTANGGTSLSSPLSAGAYARLQSAFNNKLGHAGPALYGHYKWAGGGWVGSSIECWGNALGTPCVPGVPAPNYLPAPGALTGSVGGFHDIDYGNNGLYSAMPGYDLNTGMGTFDLNGMKISFGV